MKIPTQLYIKWITIIFIFIGMTGCKKDCVSPSGEFSLYLDYSNDLGTNPSIEYDPRSSGEIKIDFSQTFTGNAVSNNLVEVVIDNVRIIDDRNRNYEITEVITFEAEEDNSDCEWREDKEFRMYFEQIEDLEVVLVLDASESLGENFDEVIEYSNSFVDQIFSTSQTTNISIVVFSDSVQNSNWFSTPTQAQSYINSISQGRFTTMYEAIDRGINLLASDSAEGRAILVFTDGNDNNSGPQYNTDYLLNKVESIPGVPISIFTIGFQGDVDRNVLELLAVNNGVSAFPSSQRDLEKVFDSFSKAISNVYRLRYERNGQEIGASDPRKLRIEFEAIEK